MEALILLMLTLAPESIFKDFRAMGYPAHFIPAWLEIENGTHKDGANTKILRDFITNRMHLEEPLRVPDNSTEKVVLKLRKDDGKFNIKHFTYKVFQFLFMGEIVSSFGRVEMIMLAEQYPGYIGNVVGKDIYDFAVDVHGDEISVDTYIAQTHMFARLMVHVKDVIRPKIPALTEAEIAIMDFFIIGKGLIPHSWITPDFYYGPDRDLSELGAAA